MASHCRYYQDIYDKTDHDYTNFTYSGLHRDYTRIT